MKKLIQPLLSAAGLLIVLAGCTNKYEGNKIHIGSFNQSIVESGELQAVESKDFVMPRFGDYWYQMKVIGLVEHGTKVKAGDSIIQLDPADVKKVIVDLETRLETEKGNLDKLLVSQNNSKSDEEINLKNAQASFDLKKLEMEYVRFESPQTKKIKELEFEQEKRALEKTKRSIVLNRIVRKNDLKIQQTQISQLQREIRAARDVLPRLTIRTPIPGIFQIAKARRTGTFLKVGDQVYEGSNLGSVPNLKKMKVETQVNEFDYSKLFIGQKVLVRLDALPSVDFKGEVTRLGKLCYKKDPKSNEKIFDVEVVVDEEDDRLKPGMTVSCEFICKELPKATFVPLNCVDTTSTGYCIYLKKGTGYLTVPVRTGPNNNTHIVIYGDFKKNQEVIPVDEIKTDD